MCIEPVRRVPSLIAGVARITGIGSHGDEPDNVGKRICRVDDDSRQRQKAGLNTRGRPRNGKNSVICAPDAPDSAATQHCRLRPNRFRICPLKRDGDPEKRWLPERLKPIFTCCSVCWQCGQVIISPLYRPLSLPLPHVQVVLNGQKAMLTHVPGSRRHSTGSNCRRTACQPGSLRRARS